VEKGGAMEMQQNGKKQEKRAVAVHPPA